MFMAQREPIDEQHKSNDFYLHVGKYVGDRLIPLGTHRGRPGIDSSSCCSRPKRTPAAETAAPVAAAAAAVIDLLGDQSSGERLRL